jgi:hypothetical protein
MLLKCGTGTGFPVASQFYNRNTAQRGYQTVAWNPWQSLAAALVSKTGGSGSALLED